MAATDVEAPANNPTLRLWQEYVIAVTVVAFCTAISVSLRSYLALTDFAILYMLGVLVVSVRYSRRPALLNAALSVVAFYYYCVPHFDSFRIADYSYVITLAGMLTVALVSSTLTLRIRAQAEEARRREEYTKELYRLREEAEMAVQKERTRNALLNAVSHDLKTPLACIYGAATSLIEEEDRLDRPARLELAESISRETERLNRILTNLLEMTRLDSGLQVAREWYPLEEIVGSAIARLEKPLQGRIVDTDIPANLPLVFVDGVLLEQVFVNLLENVARYTPPDSPVRIEIRSGKDRVAVTIEDRGPGFADGDAAHVFERFFRGKVHGIRGVGLGLAICKAIVERHGGTITAANASGGGAMIHFELPLGGVPPVMDETESVYE